LRKQAEVLVSMLALSIRHLTKADTQAWVLSQVAVVVAPVQTPLELVPLKQVQRSAAQAAAAGHVTFANRWLAEAGQVGYPPAAETATAKHKATTHTKRREFIVRKF